MQAAQPAPAGLHQQQWRKWHPSGDSLLRQTLVIILTVTVTWLWQLSQGTPAAAQSGEVLPAGTVVAFDLNVCPSGWSELTAARGRAIVGSNPAQFANPNGEGNISQRLRGQAGGAETHTLTVPEMPAHTHATLATTSQAGSGLGWWNSTSESAPQGQTSSTGGDQAHNNMPPYLVLLYCIKN